MSKFIIAKKVPASLGKGEVVIKSPDFMEQIETNTRHASKKKLTAIHHMRDILNSVQQKFEVDLDIFRVPLSKYEGLSYSTNEELSKIVIKLLKSERPEIFEKVLEYNIKNRAYGSKLIHYVGDLGDTGPFFKQGIEMIEEKDVDEYLGLKPKKVVGKPAVSKEQSEESV